LRSFIRINQTSDSLQQPQLLSLASSVDGVLVSKPGLSQRLQFLSQRQHREDSTRMQADEGEFISVIQLLDRLHCVLKDVSLEGYTHEDDDRVLPTYDKLVSTLQARCFMPLGDRDEAGSI
jgi:hypothetical protein